MIYSGEYKKVDFKDSFVLSIGKWTQKARLKTPTILHVLHLLTNRFPLVLQSAVDLSHLSDSRAVYGTKKQNRTLNTVFLLHYIVSFSLVDSGSKGSESK